MRKWWFWVGGVALVAILFAAATARNSRDSRSPQRNRPDFDVGIPTAQEVRAMLGTYGHRVESTEKEVASLKTELSDTRAQLQAAIERHQADRKKEMGAVEELIRQLRGSPEPRGEPGRTARFRTFEFEKVPTRGLAIPAGSFGEATLLTGVYAPTGGEPLPVLLRLDAALLGPGKSRVPLRDAFLVGKAQGDANSKRAIVQLETLSVVWEDGESNESKVNGWVVDDDGVQGLAGAYVWRADEILALSGLSSGLSAGADGLAARDSSTQTGPLGTVTTAITGDPLRFAAAQGVGGAFSKISEIIASRLQEITPAIYVPNARSVTVAFISGATLPQSHSHRGTETQR